MLLAPLFPWLKDEFQVSYAELGFLMTIFFVVSCAVQALSGFVVDRFGPRPVLFAGLSLLGVAVFGYSISTSYWMMAGLAVVGGVGNGVFHPVNYTLLNRKVSAPRLGYAYSVHGITGRLGWALAPEPCWCLSPWLSPGARRWPVPPRWLWPCLSCCCSIATGWRWLPFHQPKTMAPAAPPEIWIF